MVILAIDEESFAQGEFYQSDPDRYSHLEPLQAWPWQRSAYAIAIEKLMQAGARAVALDILLVDPSVYGGEDDDRLQGVLNEYGDRVVLATSYDRSITVGGPLTQQLQPLYDPTSFQPGFINFGIDVDQRIRHLPEPYLAALARETGQDSEPISFAAATLNAADIPFSPPQGNQIHFYGPARTFPQVSFWNVLEPDNWDLHLANGTFKDKLVLIGPTATSLQDIKLTPASNAMAGVELHAHTLATLMEDRAIAPLLPPGPWQGVAIGVILGGVAWGLGDSITRPLLRPLGFAGAAFLWGGIAYGLLVGGYVQIPVTIPMAVLGLGGVGYTAAGALRDRMAQQLVRRTLERYVSPPVVAEILDQPRDYDHLIGGKRLPAAVLFSDIRGFSHLSFHLPAEALVALLNTYLDAMVKAILAHRGTIDKFIGDAVMAEFGSPLSQGAKTDMLNAVRAGLAMRRSLAHLREQLQASDQPPLFHGIGISYGEVIAGNIGSEQRMEYTVIGDTVNVASRIESLTKRLGTDFLITVPAYDLIKDEIQVIDLGCHRLAAEKKKRPRCIVWLVSTMPMPVSINRFIKIYGNIWVLRPQRCPPLDPT
ncbi:MAG: CHASE2 domain-containing protein [Leptolyngbya sp. RL_3_1]|nr:CHASE2 domain-containing protein [Leptolyngbya sp. RL_3_1]